MALTSVDEVKAVLAITGSTHDTLIQSAVDAVSVFCANHCRRQFERVVDQIEYPFGGRSCIHVKHFPIESISEIKQAYDFDFDNADALAEGEDFVIVPSLGPEANCGRIEHLYGNWFDRTKSIRVKYTGGYWTGAAGEKPSTATLLPDPVNAAATQMAVHLFRNREKFGSRHISVGDMTVSEVKDGILGIARELLAPYEWYG